MLQTPFLLIMIRITLRGEYKVVKPDCGWSDFQLEGTSKYALSYLYDIALEWVEQAIHGLETMQPSCVKGFLQPSRFLCMVSYWNCHIILEDENQKSFGMDSVEYELSHTNMLQFCQYLYEDVSQNLDEWAVFVSYDGEVNQKKKKVLAKKLACLKKLISQREEGFSGKYCFL